MAVINVAVDGPAGAGKSSVSRRVAKELGYIYVDTGALYRAVGLSAMRQQIDPKDAAAVERMLDGTQVSLRFVNGEQRAFLGDEDVSDQIRTPQASMAASAVSAVPAVRAFLFALQQDIAAHNNCLNPDRSAADRSAVRLLRGPDGTFVPRTGRAGRLHRRASGL